MFNIKSRQRCNPQMPSCLSTVTAAIISDTAITEQNFTVELMKDRKSKSALESLVCLDSRAQAKSLCPLFLLSCKAQWACRFITTPVLSGSTSYVASIRSFFPNARAFSTHQTLLRLQHGLPELLDMSVETLAGVQICPGLRCLHPVEQ